jgi:hypothetical protein
MRSKRSSMGSRGASSRRGRTLTGFAAEIGSSTVSILESMVGVASWMGGGSADASTLGARGRGRGGPVVGLGRFGTGSDGRAPVADGGLEAGATDDRAAPVGAGSGRLASGAVAAGAGGGAAIERRKPSGNGMPDSRGRGRRSFDPAAELPFSRLSGGGLPLPPGTRPGFLLAGDSVLDSPSLGVEELTGRLSGSVLVPKRNLPTAVRL